MWCIGKLTKEYRQRMYDLLELYTRSYCEDEPVICIDEKSKQLLKQLRAPFLPVLAILSKRTASINVPAPAIFSWQLNLRVAVDRLK